MAKHHHLQQIVSYQIIVTNVLVRTIRLVISVTSDNTQRLHSIHYRKPIVIVTIKPTHLPIWFINLIWHSMASSVTMWNTKGRAWDSVRVGVVVRKIIEFLILRRSQSSKFLDNDSGYEYRCQVLQALIINLIFWFCRERLIHLLALRPYKKPELHDRLLKGEFPFSPSRSLERVETCFHN